jgi:class 3 adenylate cyclase
MGRTINQGDLLTIMLCGAYFLLALQSLLLFINHEVLSPANAKVPFREKSKCDLYFSFFCTLVGIYFLSRSPAIALFVADGILRPLEAASLFMILPALGLFLESMVAEKLTLPMKIYIGFSACISIAQAFFSPTFRNDCLMLWNICAVIAALFIFIYDLLIPFIRQTRLPWTEAGPAMNGEKTAKLSGTERKTKFSAFMDNLLKTTLGGLFMGISFLFASAVFDAVTEMLYGSNMGFLSITFFVFTVGCTFDHTRRSGLLFNKVLVLHESSLRFVPSQFMRHLGVEDISRLKLGDSVQRNISILFFDIRFFSIYSEMMSAEENFAFINKVLGTAGPIFHKYKGFVDKYLGDSAMVLFDDPLCAVKAGIELYQTLILNDASNIKLGDDVINIGVGIHTGNVMMGIVGENEHLSSTVISKTVNLASRMESLTKQTGSGMLITRDTMDHIGGDGGITSRFIGQVQAAGMNEAIGVFDILDALSPQVRECRIATQKIFESGIRKYHTRDYQAAQERFKKVSEADPTDLCAANCLRETERRLENPALPSIFMYDRK